jgi:hypothetical protein
MNSVMTTTANPQNSVSRMMAATSANLVTTIVASEPDRSDRGTGSGNGDRHANEQGSVGGTHLWYAKLDRGSRSTLVWFVPDPDDLGLGDLDR